MYFTFFIAMNIYWIQRRNKDTKYLPNIKYLPQWEWYCVGYSAGGGCGKLVEVQKLVIELRSQRSETMTMARMTQRKVRGPARARAAGEPAARSSGDPLPAEALCLQMWRSSATEEEAQISHVPNIKIILKLYLLTVHVLRIINYDYERCTFLVLHGRLLTDT